MFRAAFCVVIQQVLHYGDGLLYELRVRLIDWHLERKHSRAKPLLLKPNAEMSSGFDGIQTTYNHTSPPSDLYFSVARISILVKTDRSLCFEEAADAVLELVEEHGVESRAQLQTHQVLDVVADLHALFVAAHHEREQPVQELTEWRLGVALTRAHGHHGALPLAQRPHRGAVGDQAWGVPPLQTHAAQRAQETRHVNPFLRTKQKKTKRVRCASGTHYLKSTFHKRAAQTYLTVF